MKLPLKLGLPLLAALLVGLLFTDGLAQQAVVYAAILVALWTAFSLPRPSPPPQPRPLGAPPDAPLPDSEDEGDGHVPPDDAEDAGEPEEGRSRGN